MTMKESFLRAMKHVYPKGGVSPQQHRDLVRTYSMGWADALMSIEAKKDLEEWVLDHSGLADLNWWPDDSWKWW